MYENLHRHLTAGADHSKRIRRAIDLVDRHIIFAERADDASGFGSKDFHLESAHEWLMEAEEEVNNLFRSIHFARVELEESD
jgi:hypothetical protein